MPFGTDRAPYAVRMFAGSGGLGEGRRQPFLCADDAGVDEHCHYTYAQSKAEMTRFFNETGVRIGSSAAACLLAARHLAESLGGEGVVAVAFASAGSSSEWRSVEEES